jgi:hypothetical protein
MHHGEADVCDGTGIGEAKEDQGLSGFRPCGKSEGNRLFYSGGRTGIEPVTAAV